MQKNIFLLLVLLFVNGCGGFDFVYNVDKKKFQLEGITDISVDGDDSENIYISLKQSIGDISSKDTKYQLILNSSKTETASIIEKDGTASKFEIEYKISYKLYSLSKNCITLDKEITTSSRYDAKSAGYSFGTDLSKKETEIQNFNNNIGRFISSINQIKDLNQCKA